MNKALIFLDGETCKVVFGNVLKCFPISDHSKPDIEKFLEKIFSTYDVRVATSTAKTDKEAFVSAIQKASGSQMVPAQAPASMIAKSKPMSSPMVEQAKQQKSSAIQAPDFANLNWMRSTAATTIVIDDLLTNEEVRPGTGIRKAFVISPGLPSNLLGIDAQTVRQSRILANLLRNGTLVPISQAEAFRLQNEHDIKMKREEDADLDDTSPIVDRRSIMENGMGTGGHEAPPLDLTSEADLMPVKGEMPNEGYGTMSELMEQIYAPPGDAPPEEAEAEVVELNEQGDVSQSIPERVAQRQALRQDVPVRQRASAIRKRE
jgi:hypothetical protein